MPFFGTGEQMKKALASLVILLAFSGVVFYFGWTSFAIPAGSHGVLTTKTGGVDTLVIQSGVFRWDWERIIPTNARLTPFIVAPRTVTIASEGVLPSGTLYAAALEGTPDFTWKISGSVLASLEPSRLPFILRDEGVTDQAKLDAWIDRRVDNLVESAIRETLSIVLSDGSSAVAGLTDPIALGALISSRIQASSNGDFTTVSISIDTLSVPDTDLYRLAKTTYLAYLQEKTRLFSVTSMEEAGLAVSDRFTIDRFERWGELLTKYPILIQFLSLSNGDPSAALSKIRDQNQ